MKYIDKKMVAGLISASVAAVGIGMCGIQAFAQSDDSANTTVLISEVPQTGSWGYPAERGPWAERLGLSDKQLEQLVSLKSEFSVRTAKEKAELKADRKKLMLLMTEPTVDKEAVLSLHEKMKSLQSDLSDSRVNQMLGAMERSTHGSQFVTNSRN